MDDFKLPKRIKDNTKRPIEQEVRILEQEYMRLLANNAPTNYDIFLIDYCHKRCDKLWKKIARRR